jgi:hypothetical protein
LHRAHTSGFCSALPQFSHSVPLLSRSPIVHAQFWAGYSKKSDSHELSPVHCNCALQVCWPKHYRSPTYPVRRDRRQALVMGQCCARDQNQNAPISIISQSPRKLDRYPHRPSVQQPRCHVGLPMCLRAVISSATIVRIRSGTTRVLGREFGFGACICSIVRLDEARG